VYAIESVSFFLRPSIMFATQASVSWWTWPLHVTLVIIGAYLIANLALAVIFINFNKHYSSGTKTSDAMPTGTFETGGGTYKRAQNEDSA